jgi:dihydrofolate synthase/folylpolyglutamate synthase
MNYEEAVAYIDETPKFTKKNSLDHTKECLRRLGNPQDKFKVIHVAGTNGKGSERGGIFLRIIYFSSSGGDQ